MVALLLGDPVLPSYVRLGIWTPDFLDLDFLDFDLHSPSL